MFNLIPSHYPRYRSKARNIINYRQVEKKILDDILGSEVYDTRLRPPGQNKSVTATLVYVNIFVRDFSAISDVTMVGWHQSNYCSLWTRIEGIRLLHHSETEMERQKTDLPGQTSDRNGR